MRAILCFLLLSLFSGQVQARPLLRNSVPSDAVLYGHWWSQPRTGFADVYLRRVRDALRDSGVVEQYIDLLRSGVEEKEREDFDVAAGYWTRFLADVPWWRMLSREVAFGAVVAQDDGIRWTFLFRTGVEERDEVLLALRWTLYGFCAGFDGYEMLVGDRGGVPTCVLYNLVDPEEQICIGGHDGVVVVTTSAHLLRRTLNLLEGRGSDLGFSATDRYLDSQEKLPERTGEIEGDAEPSAGFELVFAPRDALRRLPALRVLSRYHVAASAFPGRIQWRHRLDLADYPENILLRAYARPAGVEDLLKNVPAGVSCFEATAGGDPEAVYEYFMDFLATATGGPRLPGLVQSLQARFDLDVRERLLRYLSGRRVYLSFTSTQALSRASEGGGILLLELKKAEDAQQKVEEFLDGTSEALRELGLEVEKDETAKGALRYRVATRSLLGREVQFGLADGDAFVASSAEALDRALAAEREGGTSIPEETGFSKVWKLPLGQVERISYGTFDERLKSAASVLRFLGGLAAFLPREGETGLLRPILTVLPRFQPVIEALDFVDREIGYSARESTSFHGRSTTYLRRIASF